MIFSLGQAVATRGVADKMESDLDFAAAVGTAIARHSDGDWGDVCDEDRAANDAAVKSGERLHSAYEISGRKIWIITEADRSATTVLFPSEY